MAIRLKQEGTDDFVLIERGAGRGRHLVGEQLSGRAVRRSLEPLLVLVRAQSGLDARVSDARRRSRSTCATAPTASGSLRHTRLGCELLGATWVAERQRWELETSGGRSPRACWWPRPGCSASRGRPRCRGLERFEGNAFHTARWDHGDDLTGKRVGADRDGRLGGAGRCRDPAARRRSCTSSSARRRGWSPHMDHPVRPRLARAYRRVPALQRALARGHLLAARAAGRPGITRDPRLLKAAGAGSRDASCAARSPTRSCARRLTPDYADRLQAPRALERVVSRAPGAERRRSSARASARCASIRSSTGTGSSTRSTRSSSRPASRPRSCRSRSASTARDGRSLAEVWDGSPQAYLGTTVTGFPNLFLLYGPNLNLGTPRSSTCSSRRSPTPATRSGRCAARRGRVRGARRGRRTPTTRSSRSGWRTVWNTRLRQLVLRPQRPQLDQWPGFTFEFRRRTRRFDAAGLPAGPGRARYFTRGFGGAGSVTL